MTDVEPPVMREDELVVECSSSECDETTTIGTDVDAVEAEEDRNKWRVSFIPTEDGRLEVDNAECPDHRLVSMIDSLAYEQKKFARDFEKTMNVAEKIKQE